MTRAYTDEIERLTEQFYAGLRALGAKYREEVVVPACRKHRLHFRSFQGSFFFHKKTTKHDGYELPLSSTTDPEFGKYSASAQATLRPILDMLNTQVKHNDSLGEYVSDVE